MWLTYIANGTSAVLAIPAGSTHAIVDSPTCTSQTSFIGTTQGTPQCTCTCSWLIGSRRLWYGPRMHSSVCSYQIVLNTYVHGHMRTQLLLPVLCFPNDCSVWVSWFAPYRPLTLASYTCMSKEHQRPLGGCASLNPVSSWYLYLPVTMYMGYLLLS